MCYSRIFQRVRASGFIKGDVRLSQQLQAEELLKQKKMVMQEWTMRAPKCLSTK